MASYFSTSWSSVSFPTARCCGTLDNLGYKLQKFDVSALPLAETPNPGGSLDPELRFRQNFCFTYEHFLRNTSDADERDSL